MISTDSDEINWIREKVGDYLNGTVAKTESEEGVFEFIEELKREFVGASSLTRGEMLQLVNLAPRTDAEVHLVSILRCVCI